jgi:hypothetical protein
MTSTHSSMISTMQSNLRATTARIAMNRAIPAMDTGFVSTGANVLRAISVPAGRQDRALIEDGLRRIIVLIMATSTESDETVSREWMTLIATYSFLLHPEIMSETKIQLNTLTEDQCDRVARMFILGIATGFPTDQLVEGSISDTQVQAVVDTIPIASVRVPKEDIRAVPGTDLTDAIAQFDVVTASLGLPQTKPGNMLYYFKFLQWREAEMHGQLGIITFLAGKELRVFPGTQTRAERNNYSILTSRRPQVIEATEFEGEKQLCLSGMCGISVDAGKRIFKAWAAYPDVRFDLISNFIKFGAARASREQRLVFVSVNLLENSGMQFASIISDFLNAHPKAFEIEELLPAIQSFAAAYTAYGAMDYKTAAYSKLLYGNLSKLYNPRAILPLRGIACQVLAETDPTIIDYAYIPNDVLRERLRELEKPRVETVEPEEE